MAVPIGALKRAEAIRLRVHERLGLQAIAERTGISKATLSVLLRDYPLSPDERRERSQIGAAHAVEARDVYRPTPSAAAQAIGLEHPRGVRRALARAAVIHRLVGLGFEILGIRQHPSMVLVRAPRGGAIRVLVRTAVPERWGRPIVRLDHQDGTPVTTNDCDVVAGYDLLTDTVFVFPVNPAAANRRSCQPELADAWAASGVPAFERVAPPNRRPRTPLRVLRLAIAAAALEDAGPEEPPAGNPRLKGAVAHPTRRPAGHAAEDRSAREGSRRPVDRARGGKGGAQEGDGPSRQPRREGAGGRAGTAGAGGTRGRRDPGGSGRTEPSPDRTEDRRPGEGSPPAGRSGVRRRPHP